MASPAVVPASSIPARVPVPGWAVALTVVGMAFLYLALQENGALLAQHAVVLHEFFHDGRHALGVPCH
jgi:hypothetical protein